MDRKFMLKKIETSQMGNTFGILVSSVISFVWLIIGRRISQVDYSNLLEGQKIAFSNMKILIVAVCLFVISYLVTVLATRKRLENELKRGSLVVIYVFLILFLIAALWLEDKFVVYNQTDFLYRHVQLFPIYLLLVAFFVNLYVFYFEKEDESKRWFRKLMIFGVSISAILFTFIPNPIDLHGGGYHFDAYINSIMNVCALAPYSYEVNSIYGHYGIFFIIPVKILRFIMPTKWHAISLAIAIVGGVTYALFLAVANKYIKRDSVFFIVSLAVGTWSFAFTRGNYYQHFPHRWFFQAVSLYFIMRLVEKPEAKVRKMVLIFVEALAIVWNTETGIICAVACCVIFFTLQHQNGEKLYINIVSSIFKLILILFLAYGIVAFYNKCVGGKLLSIKDYIYPLGAQEYSVGGLQLALDIPISLYFIYFVVFMSVFCVLGCRILFGENDKKLILIWICSIIGLGVFPYYINRVSFGNMQISTPMFVVILAAIVDSCSNLSFKMSENINTILGRFALCVLMTFAIESVFNVDETINNLKGSLYDTEPLEQLTSDIGDLPEGTNIIGLYASVLSMCVSEGNMLYTMDWEDMHVSGQVYYYNETMNNPEIKYILASKYASYSSDVKLMFPNAVNLQTYKYVDNKGTEFEWDLYELNR